MAAWCRAVEGGLQLAIRVSTGTRSTEVTGVAADELKLRLQAVPVHGQANAALICFLAKRLGIPQKALHLLRGSTSRHKLLLVQADLDLAQAQRALLPDLAGLSR